MDITLFASNKTITFLKQTNMTAKCRGYTHFAFEPLVKALEHPLPKLIVFGIPFRKAASFDETSLFTSSLSFKFLKFVSKLGLAIYFPISSWCSTAVALSVVSSMVIPFCILQWSFLDLLNLKFEGYWCTLTKCSSRSLSCLNFSLHDSTRQTSTSSPRSFRARRKVSWYSLIWISRSKFEGKNRSQTLQQKMCKLLKRTSAALIALRVLLSPLNSSHNRPSSPLELVVRPDISSDNCSMSSVWIKCFDSWKQTPSPCWKNWFPGLKKRPPVANREARSLILPFAALLASMVPFLTCLFWENMLTRNNNSRFPECTIPHRSAVRVFNMVYPELGLWIADEGFLKRSLYCKLLNTKDCEKHWWIKEV